MRPGPDDHTDSLLSNLTDFSPSSDRDFLFVPTIHLVRAIQDAYVSREVPIIPDQVTTLREFCRRFHESAGSPAMLISDGQSLQLLSETLEAIRKDIPFFFSRHNPAPTTLKDLLALRDIISQRKIAFFKPELIQNSEKCRQIHQALEAYETALLQKGLLDATGLIEWTISAIGNGPSCSFGTVIFRGFHQPLPREKELISAIRDHAELCRYDYPTGKDCKIFDIPDWFGDGITPLKESSLSGLFTSEECQNHDGFRIGIFQSPHEEFESIAEEICSLNDSKVALEDITVALPDISAHSLITGIFHDFNLPCRVLTGEALNREPQVGFFTLFPSLVVNNFPREDLISLISSPFFKTDQPDLILPETGVLDTILRKARIMEGPCWDHDLEALAGEKTCGIGDEKGEPVDPDDLTAVRMFASTFQASLLTLKVEQTVADHVTAFRLILEHWVKPEFVGKPDTTRVTEREKRAWERFDACLTRLSVMTDPDRKIGAGSFNRYLNYLLEELVTIGEDHGGVTVMRLSETAHLNLPVLFLAGLVEGDIPRPSTRLPLLTAAESEVLGGRNLAEVISGEQYSFISAISAGRQVYLSAPRTRREKTLLTSPFLEEVRQKLSPPEWNPKITRSKRHASISAGGFIAKGTVGADEILNLLPANQTYGSVAERILIEDWYRTGVPDSPYDGIVSDEPDIVAWLSKKFGPEKVWAPTRLETYATCPFRFFLQRVLNLSQLPDVDPSLTPAQRGNFIHETICDFFRQWSQDGPKHITSYTLPDAARLLKEIGKEKSGRYHFTSSAWHAALLSLFGTPDTSGLFDRFLMREVAREDSSLLPRYFELEIRDCQDKNPDEKGEKRDDGGREASDMHRVLLDQGEGEPILISGRIDRVDISSDGYFAIIDYKTGGSYPSAKGIKEGTALQLPLYLLALEKMHEGDEIPLTGIAGSYCEISRKIKQTWPLLSPDQKNLIGAGTSRATSGFREVILSSLEASRNCICQIRCGRFPLPDTCQVPYCEFSGICRFDRFRISSNGDES
ncbi:MAG TPA: PD-(D/E)XK nuclease family protein [Methanospirillum sp.]|uniref:PD-(D/E)XK nuclease family protein n=1 Tax=Methanospirillum sp. TaxID=45200 RepID=UPI002B9A519B|nr:PD-(D/E)XK nuclease family protein [Methanospirillum sp.]HWQ62782.1 PD-(D/E)XK nuclease family protein [Methanospirillum sp.]